MPANRLIFVLIFLFNLNPAFSQGFPTSSDKDYNIVETEDYNFIYPQEYSKYAKMVVELNKDIKTEYQKSYNWTLDERTSLVLASSYNQVANAFATVVPNNLTVFFPAGVSLFDRFATSSWLGTLLIHETAHLYQLNPKRSLSKIANKVFGNNPVTLFPVPLLSGSGPFFLPLPIFTFPNIVTPTLMIEGNATFNESRFGLGGRLFSGEYKAMFYGLLERKRLSVNRLTNNILQFPFNTEKYIVGAYVNLALAELFGVDKVNSFFYEHSTHYFNPFNLSETFERIFDMSYSRAVTISMKKFYKEARKFKLFKSKPLVTSLTNAGFGRWKKGAMFLAQESGRKEPLAYKFDKNGKIVSKKQIFVPFGRPFEIKGKTYTSGSQIVDLRKTIYSLWSDGLDRIKKMDGVLVSDVRNGQLTGFDIDKSFDQPQLLVDGKNVGKAHSSSVLDKAGNVYRFVQKRKTRSLYKNTKKIFDLESYYGRPVDVDSDGGVYFVTNSRYGSGLYRYYKGSFQRVPGSDGVVDARLINNKKLLVVEITPDGYSVKKVPLTLKSEKPYVLRYFFEKEEENKFVNKVEKARITAKKSTLKSESYSSLTNWRFNSWDFFSQAGDDFEGQANFYFSDALLYNSLLFSARRDDGVDENEFELLFSNRSYLLNWSFYGQWRERNLDRKSIYPTRIDEKKALLLGTMPFARVSDWDFALTYGAGPNRTDGEIFIEQYASLSIDQNRAFFLSFFPTKVNRLLAEYERSPNNWSSVVTYEFGRELFGDFHLHSVLNYSIINDIVVESGQSIAPQGRPLIPLDEFEVLNVSGKDVKSARLGLAFKQVINYSATSRWIPFGIRRFAPVVYGNYNSSEANNKVERYEYGIGVDAELIIGHVAPVRVETYLTELDYPTKERILRLNFKGSF